MQCPSNKQLSSEPGQITIIIHQNQLSSESAFIRIRASNNHHTSESDKVVIRLSTRPNGGFFVACVNLGRMCDHSFPACAFFFFFLFSVEISSSTLRPGSVYGGSASLDDCGRVVLDKLRVNSFPDRFPHYAWTAA